MAKLWAINKRGELRRRYYVTEREARLSMGAGDELSELELDELELRQAAANWLTASATKQAAAIKREANKTAKQRSDNMRKAWATRRTKNES